MILSKICKANGSCEDGVTHWNQNLSAWLLEHGAESEEFRPFFALSPDGERPPAKDQFNPAEEGLTSTRAIKDQWEPIRPTSNNLKNKSTKSSVFESVVDVNDPTSMFDDEDDFPEVNFDGEQIASDPTMNQANDFVEEVPSYEEGYEAGLAQGVQQGQKDAVRLADQKVSELRQKVESVISALIESRQMALEELDEDLARLSMHIARQILRAELSLSPTAIQRLVEVSLENFSPDDAPRVCLNPSDLEMMRQVDAPLFDKVSWVADENLSSGSVRVECGERRTEDLVEERLSAVANKLLKDVDAIFLKPIVPMADHISLESEEIIKDE